LGYSPVFPSNLGISDANLSGITCKKGECNMGSFVNLDKYGRSKEARKVILDCFEDTGNTDEASKYQ
jgi:hypothetical protein